MNKKILFCATVDYHFKAFHLPYLKWLKDMGWEVHVAANGNIALPFVDRKFQIPIQRSPFEKENYQAYKALKAIIKENNYQIIDCHTPMGGVLARLARKKASNGKTKLIYTAHGFHFCRGAPILNWFIYYPIEKVLAYFTDCLLTINSEDYNLAKNHHFKAGMIKHIHGVGINTDVFTPVKVLQKNILRNANGYDSDHFLMFYAAEFNKNKNQQLLIRALAEIKEDVPNARLLLAGEGHMLTECQLLAENLGVQSMVDFLGFRSDIDSLLKMCDLGVASSIREGLPVNVMEAMACGLPIVATDNRGHRELVSNSRNGWLIQYKDIHNFATKIKLLAKNEPLVKKLGAMSRKRVEEKYTTEKVLSQKIEIISSYINELEEVRWKVQ